VNSSAKKLALVVAPIVVLLAVLYFVFRGGEDELTVKQPAGQQRSGAEVEADPEYIIVGGVRRKATDVKPVQRSVNANPRPTLDTGKTEAVAFDLNANTESIREALETGQHPERLSSFIQPEPFDAESYGRDPQAYLDVVEPARVFQPAQPGPGVEVLRQLSPRFTRIKQTESTKLRVQAVPDAPVTFTSFDLGKFQNQLTSVTVAANNKGIAEAEFFGRTGTYSNVNILAASPMTSGQVKFGVFIEVPVINASNQDSSGPGTGG
jgi:hypothetical protein